jgi:hypothetical protein
MGRECRRLGALAATEGRLDVTADGGPDRTGRDLGKNHVDIAVDPVKPTRALM